MSYANTRKAKREKKKSENMLKNLFITIHHYDKQFFEDMNKIHDPRCQVYITYPLEVMIVTRMLAYCCHIQSMAEMKDDFNKASVIKNVSEICGVDLETYHMVIPLMTCSLD